MKNEIIVAYDFSPMADAALAWAAAIASEGTPVKVVYVVALLPYTESVAPIPPPNADEIRALENDVRRKAVAQGLTAEIRVELAASVGGAIVAMAKNDRARQIIIGTHGRSMLTRAILGSVADYVVRHAECPVTTIRHAEPAPAKTAGRATPSSSRGTSDAPATT